VHGTAQQIPIKRKTAAKPLELLRKVRDVLASGEKPQSKLDLLTKTIASGMGCEVCSLYLLRAGDVLELYASEGLRHDAVHSTRLNIGEGLVGEIAATAKPLNLADADKHPKFVYRPETGEEIFRSFVGVPILYSNSVIGVLVAQSKVSKSFSPGEIEVLQTVAMILAEQNAAGQFVSTSELREGGSTGIVSQHIVGQRLSPGLARGPAVLHQRKIAIKKIVAEDPGHELERLQKAVEALRRSVDELIRQSEMKEGDEHADIMETYRMFTHDQGWIDQISEAIGSGLTAEAAVKKVQDELHARMSQVSSQYIKERIQDLEDLSSRLLLLLTGEEIVPSQGKLPAQFILVARNIGPAELLEYGRKRIRGLILEEGSATSHIVIIARAMDVPVVGKIDNATRIIQPDDPVVVDGDNGEIYIRPYDDVNRTITEHLRQRQERESYYESVRALPSVTLDGIRVSVNINVGLFLDGKHLQEQEVDGVGLFRTELPYMVSDQLPSVSSQRKTYSKILRQANDKPVIFRTFDIGGDKQLPYFPIDQEENPAMGWRATRIGLDRPAILRRQFRALLEAGSDKILYIMLPFITHVQEIDAARALLDMEITRAKTQGRYALPKAIKLGTMIEVPAILWQMEELVKRVDFVSIGSNDLMQFLFACDRGSPRMVDRYDPLSPVVLNLLKNIADTCHKAGVNVGFCGEMARKPLEAMALIAIGLRSLSMPPSSIGPVKAMIRSINHKHVSDYITHLCATPSMSIRSHLMQYARDHGVSI